MLLSHRLARAFFVARFAPVLAPLLALAALCAPAGAETQERWYVVRMMDERAGWMRSVEHTLPDGDVRIESEMTIKIGRGPVAVEMVIRSETVESGAGELRFVRTEQRLGAAPLVTEWTFKTDGSVAVVDEQGGRRVERAERAPEGDWLAPAAAARHVKERMRAGDETISVTTIDPTGGLRPITSTRRLRGRGPVEAMGKVVPASEWIVEHDIFPGVEGVEYLDDEGELVRGETNMGGITLLMLLSEKAVATAPVAPPELLASTLVEPSRLITRPRAATRAVYTLRVREGEMLDLPTAGAQRAERIDANAARVTVDTTRIPAADPADANNPAFLAPSRMLDAKDPEIVALVERAFLARGAPLREGPVAERAEHLRRYVHGFIDAKSLDVGFASASQTARTRQGDCTEHAVLLAAMLRADNIPSRVVSGLIYVEEFVGRKGVFGFHMWTQALLPDERGAHRWVDLDATLEGEAPSDAAHIALAHAALDASDEVNSMVTLAPLLGRLEIVVESVE